MKYPYFVVHNGVEYPIGSEVPDGDEVVSEVEENQPPKYSKTEINRMPLVDLKVLAKENGIDDSKSGAEIKKELISLFQL